MIRALRQYSTPSKIPKFKLDPGSKLKCGLEVHTQLNTRYKLFSLSPTSTTLPMDQTDVNTKVSYFDVGLPGTQPTLNPEAVLQALKLSIVLESEINAESMFDRKHYFYGDQPLGYQITQHYNPVARGGQLVLHRRFDDIDTEEKTIRIEQLQIEQDTGRSIYKKEGITEVDLNRANSALVELVTKPDFRDLKEIKAFIRKFQLILKKTGISTADLETGAMRVDVNVSVNDGPRVELKNLSNTTAIISAVKYEYMRQITVPDQVQKETRGWDGATTFALRDKETTMDYRYMADPELPSLRLDVDDLVHGIKNTLLPELPNETLQKLMDPPYSCKLRDAMILLQDEALMEYYVALSESLQAKGIDTKHAVNWCCHELQGALAKSGLAEFRSDFMPHEKLSHLIQLVHTDKVISNNNAKLLFVHLLSNRADLEKDLEALIDEFEMRLAPSDGEEVDIVVQQVLAEHAELVVQLQRGEKSNSLNFLLGQCMRLSRGKIDNKVLLQALKKAIFSA